MNDPQESPVEKSLEELKDSVFISRVGAESVKQFFRNKNLDRIRKRQRGLMQSFSDCIRQYEEAINGKNSSFGDAYDYEDLERIKTALANAILVMFGFPLQLPEKPTPVEVKLANSGPGFVYAMKNMRNGMIKIGWSSKAPEYREKTLQSEEPEIELVGKWEAPREIEKLLHAKFEYERQRGEWFTVDVEEIRAFFDGKDNGDELTKDSAPADQDSN